MHGRNGVKKSKLKNGLKKVPARTISIPVRILELATEGKITSKELHLLIFIEYFTRQDEGCYATNRYFGKLIDLHPVNISKHISHLKELGILRVKWGLKKDKKMRFIELNKHEMKD